MDPLHNLGLGIFAVFGENGFETFSLRVNNSRGKTWLTLHKILMDFVGSENLKTKRMDIDVNAHIRRLVGTRRKTSH